MWIFGLAKAKAKAKAHTHCMLTFLPSAYALMNTLAETRVLCALQVFGGLGPLGASDTSESILTVLTNLGVRISFAVLQGLIMKVLTTGK